MDSVSYITELDAVFGSGVHEHYLAVYVSRRLTHRLEGKLMPKTPIEYWPAAYNFGACTDLREYVQQKLAEVMVMPIVCKDPPSPSEPVKPNPADTPVDGDGGDA